jgi:predicted DNA-binding ribbon-helix-helix protein
VGTTGIDAGTRMTKSSPTVGGERMRKRSVVIAGHRTSVSLENVFWSGLKEIADDRGISVNRLVESIDSARATNLSSAIRVFVLQSFKADSALLGD